MKRTDMNKLREVLRLRHDLGLTMDEIADAASTSKATVFNVLKRAETAAVSWPLPEGMTHDELHARIYPPVVVTDDGRLQPDWSQINKELDHTGSRAAKVTRVQLWEEYRGEAEAAGLKAYGRSRFLELLGHHRKGGIPEMRFDYVPGDYAMSDFSGKTLQLTTPQGESAAEIFVCTLNYSQMIFAMALEDQTLASWVEGHEKAFRYLGGVSKKLVVDNLKSGVRRWDHFDPSLNPSFAEFARHYNVAVLPARRYSPRDKGAVEQAVKTVQSRVLVPLRKTRFMSLADMNAAIRPLLDTLNSSPMAKYGTSRIERFEAEEKARLQPLPLTRWEYAHAVERKVGPNGHVQFDYGNYSVPYRYVGEKVWVRYTKRMVEILLKNGDSVATHRRSTVRNAYRTCEEHQPPEHVEMARRRSPKYQAWLVSRLTGFGEHAASWAHHCLESRDFPSQAYGTLRGAVTLGDKWGPYAVNSACYDALSVGNFTYGFLRDHLADMARETQDDPIPDHPNIRGSAYYSDEPE